MAKQIALPGSSLSICWGAKRHKGVGRRHAGREDHLNLTDPHIVLAQAAEISGERDGGFSR